MPFKSKKETAEQRKPFLVASNFFNYFASNFKELGLKKLIASCFRKQTRDLFNTEDNVNGFYYEYTGKEGESKNPSLSDLVYFKGDGDFRSQECIKLLKESQFHAGIKKAK